jgi:hypothetical protein
MLARLSWLLALVILHAGAAAAANEPTVYVFWSSDGERSKQAVNFLLSATRADPSLSVRYFQLDESADNRQLLERVYQRIGVPGLYAIPSIFIGANVFMGFDSVENAGKSILNSVAKCRRESCVDLVRDLIEPGEPQAPLVRNEVPPGTHVTLYPADRDALADGRPVRCAALPIDLCQEQ